ncbi:MULTISPECIES: hypothetical protein [Flavobacterium]|mgnify:FL=1|jgi:uncharacterized membrane protein YecN with MAPEG domain|uniref:DUF4199 domain-containing protein n=1 Tax=Flavobacterium anhuiense TaxID=459526 RepID=A0ABY0M7P1_9FLAO|nr:MULTISPECIES: hypothetical protein [Flavobacterium]EJG00046.1 hypothetical protein FF52_18163 [Flavobacterium sp. F52]URM36467.1 hypothetical protein LLY39_18945 [Flavobacterium anhuiense]SCZ01038.1 hypothetical protein SAMN02927916_0097 [Flavobacterium anhuiense]
MKLQREIINGFLIFVGIALFFLLMELLNLSNLFYLRLLNVIFIFYGVNRSLKMNLAEGKNEFVPNAISAMVTSFTAVVISIVALLIYSYAKGGDKYVKSLSEAFMFGGEPSVTSYCLSLLFEGTASCIIVTLLLMLYWNNKYVAD